MNISVCTALSSLCQTFQLVTPRTVNADVRMTQLNMYLFLCIFQLHKQSK